MVLLSDLVSICAEHGLDSESTLSQFARELREAGRVSKAGRGRGAARMTFLDAARFLIACAATDHPKRAAEAEQFFSAYLRDRAETSNGCWSMPVGIALDQGFALMLETLASGKLDDDAVERAKARAKAEGHTHVFAIKPSPELILDRSGGAIQIELSGAGHHFVFWHSSMIALMQSLDALEGAERARVLQDEAEKQAIRFRTGKNLTARLESKLLRTVANAIAGNAA